MGGRAAVRRSAATGPTPARGRSDGQLGHTSGMDVLERVEAHIRAGELIPPGGEVTCLVSGGADSTCLWHVLGELGYRVRAVHVHHGLRGAEADADAEHCAARSAPRSSTRPPAGTEAELRELRYELTAGQGLRATGHTASDQVETVLYRLVSSGSTRGIRARRADGVVRPLLPLWREETEAYCATPRARVAHRHDEPGHEARA